MANISSLIAQRSEELKAARKRRIDLMDERKDILESVQREGRQSLTRAESAKVESLRTQAEDMTAEIADIERRLAELRAIDAEESRALADASTAGTKRGATPPGGARSYRTGREGDNGMSDRSINGHKWMRSADGRPADLATGQRFAEHDLVREETSRASERDRLTIATYGDFGQLTRALSTTGASAVVPQVWSNNVIDLIRNKAAVLQAGARMIPMNSKTVNVGRLITDPTAAFKAESSPISASDPAFDSVTLTAKTMTALVVGSMEFFMDSIDGQSVVENALAQALALKLDSVALWGGLLTAENDEGFTTDANNPVGILKSLLNDASGNVLGYATNGTAITAATPFNEVLDAVYQPKLANHEPNALLWNTKMAKKLSKTYLSDYSQLPLPRELQQLRIYETNQIPSYTRGTMSNVATDIFVGDFSELLVGTRMGLEVRVLTERYAENGQVALLATMRLDLALAHPLAFAVYRALGGS